MPSVNVAFFRYTQVRQQSVEIASRIRENVKLAKEKEVAEIKKKVTDAIVQRAASRTDSSPIHLSPIEAYFFVLSR